MQPTTPLVLCVLLSQVGKRGLLGAPEPLFCIPIAWRGLGEGAFVGLGDSGCGGEDSSGAQKGGHSQPLKS